MSNKPDKLSSDKSRLASNVDKSKFSTSKLAINPDRSSCSTSRPANFSMAEMEFMSSSKLFRIPTRSDILIDDRSISGRSISNVDKSMPSESINPVKSSSIASRHE